MSTYTKAEIKVTHNIFWEITNDDPDCEEDDKMCDWDKFTVCELGLI